MPWNVKVIDNGKIEQKLDPKRLIAPHTGKTFEELAEFGHRDLLAQIPRRTGKTASRIASEHTESQSVISGPRYPLVFLERGSQYPAAGRSHRRRRAVAASGLRIKPRRFIARTRAHLRAELTKKIKALAAAIEKAWAS